MEGYVLELDYGVTAISNVLTRTGNRGFGEHLSGYAIQDAAAVLYRDQWSVTLFAKNLFDAYAETSAAQTRAYIQTAADGNGDPCTSGRTGTTCCRRGCRGAVYVGNGALIEDRRGVQAPKTGISARNPDILLRHSIHENLNGDQAEDPVFPEARKQIEKDVAAFLKSGKRSSGSRPASVARTVWVTASNWCWARVPKPRNNVRTGLG
jgi:hypothetical protein